jgi:hypothetical protein
MAEEELGEELKTEREGWHHISAGGLAAAYEESEPEYSDQSIKQRNPEFRP